MGDGERGYGMRRACGWTEIIMAHGGPATAEERGRQQRWRATQGRLMTSSAGKRVSLFVTAGVAAGKASMRCGHQEEGRSW
jgi:hypothetical protein